jgi:hypothetical protein
MIGPVGPVGRSNGPNAKAPRSVHRSSRSRVYIIDPDWTDRPSASVWTITAEIEYQIRASSISESYRSSEKLEPLNIFKHDITVAEAP